MRIAQAAVLAVAFFASPARANDEAHGTVLYVTVEGVDGESRDPGHENQIRGFHYSETWRADSSWTKGGGASVGKPVLGPAVFTKVGGKASQALKRNIARGTSIPKVTFEFYEATREGPPKLSYRITYQEVFVVGVSEKTVEGVVLDEIQLIFKKGKWETFDPQATFDFDVATGSTAFAPTTAGSSSK
jgi:type VI protein secretion system component Hcp